MVSKVLKVSITKILMTRICRYWSKLLLWFNQIAIRIDLFDASAKTDRSIAFKEKRLKLCRNVIAHNERHLRYRSKNICVTKCL